MRKIISYPWDVEGEFVERKNRFLGIVKTRDGLIESHIHDSGRLEEILFKGNRVLLKRVEGKHRKTKWDVVLGKVGHFFIPINSSVHRKISETLIREFKIFGEAKRVKPEFKFGESRIDFLVEKENERLLVEVKGCTLSLRGVALFPDAPTSRGVKHMKSLISSIKENYKPYILILVFRPDSICFLPNEEKDPLFSEVFYKALEEGVGIKPIVIEYKNKWLYYKGEIGLCRR